MIPLLVIAGLAVLLLGVALIVVGSFRTKDVGFVLFLLGAVLTAIGAGIG